MRLNEIKEILESYVGYIRIAKDDVPAQKRFSNELSVVVSGVNLLVNSLDQIEKTGIFKKEINELKESKLYKNPGDKIYVSTGEIIKIQVRIDSIYYGCKGIISAINGLRIEDDPEALYIKLPPVKSLSTFKEILGKLDTAFSQSILNEDIKGKAEIRSVDVGSIFLVINLGPSEAYFLIGGLVWAACAIINAIEKAKINEEYLKGLKIKTESLKDIKDTQKKHIEMLEQNEAENLYNQHFQKGDKDQIGRLKHSIKLFSELIKKGTEIYPALNAPDNLSSAMPDFKELKNIVSQIPQISEGKKQ